VSQARDWRQRRALLAAAATLQRVRLAQQTQSLRAALRPTPAAGALALGLAAAWAWRRRAPHFMPSLLLRVLQAWRAERGGPRAS
jgi:hypothetical protein